MWFQQSGAFWRAGRSAWVQKYWLRAASLALAGALAGCGGGSGGASVAVQTPAPTDTSTVTTPAVPVAPLVAMVDSFNRPVDEASFGGGDSGASGGDGTAGDGAPLVNAAVRVADSAGRSVTTRTDANGYYRVRIDGFVPPFIATVTNAAGRVWVSPSVSAVKVRGFVTINLTGLTDKVASDVATAAGLKASEQLTPSALAANLPALQAAKSNLNTQLTAQIVAAGLNPATFDPVTLPFKPDLTGYDKVLESVSVSKTAAGVTVVTAKNSLGGSIAGLGALAGLTLVNGSETLSISANATTFTFPTPLLPGTAYAVTVGAQPSGLVCAVSNGSSVMGSSAVTNVAVVCGSATRTLGGTVSGLGAATGLVLAEGAQTLVVPAGAASFTFANGLPIGGSYAVRIVTQPAGLTCTVSNGSGTMGSSSALGVAVICSANSAVLGGPVSGLGASGLVLANGAQQVVVASGAASYAFATPLALGSSYNVVVQTQPTGHICTVSNGTGTMTGPVSNAAVSCTPLTYSLGGQATGLGTSGSVTLVTNGQAATAVWVTGAFGFPTPLAYGTAYNVLVQAATAGLTCSVSNGSGTITANVGNVAVSCVSGPYAAYGGTYVGTHPNGSMTVTVNGSTGAVSGSESGWAGGGAISGQMGATASNPFTITFPGLGNCIVSINPATGQMTGSFNALVGGGGTCFAQR